MEGQNPPFSPPFTRSRGSPIIDAVDSPVSLSNSSYEIVPPNAESSDEMVDDTPAVPAVMDSAAVMAMINQTIVKNNEENTAKLIEERKAADERLLIAK